MTTQEEWRQKAYEEQVGRSGNNSMGTQANDAGYRQYLEEQKRSSGGGGGGGGCFPAGTMIHTEFGRKDISSISKGDYVISINKISGRAESKRILKVQRHSNNSIWVLELTDGKKVKTTSVHSFSSNGKWVKASKLKSGDSITITNGQGNIQDGCVVSSFPLHQTEAVYNLIVEDNFSFVAEGFVVHSFTSLRLIQTSFWSLVSSLRNARPRALESRYHIENKGI